MLYFAGAALALILTMIGVPALAFSLGMFIPLQLNIPLLVGGAVQWYVSTRSKDAEVNKARSERGTLLASGFIAGGALMGVVSAGLTFAGFDGKIQGGLWMTGTYGQLLALATYLMLIAYLIRATRK